MPASAQSIDAEAQEKVTELLQKVIQDYWNGGGSGQDKVTNPPAIDTNVEGAFRAASALMPQRLDLRFGIASALMGQAVQTNGAELRVRVGKALEVYRQIQTMDPKGFAAPILYAAFARAIGRTNDSESALNGLLAAAPMRTREYLQRFDRIDRIFESPPNTKPQKNFSSGKYAILVLGAGLETNGTIKSKLIERLEQGSKLAKLNPQAPVILTGGNQKGGVTEAYIMSLWCSQRGISGKRLILEDKARDTVENAIFSAAILQRLGVNHVTVVTSASHLRRGMADLQEACLQRGLRVWIDGLAAVGKADTKLDPEQERVGVYRDAMRVSGLWAFPGLQR